MGLIGRGRGWGGRLFEAGRLLTFSTFRMGAYSTWALIRGWALIRINTATMLHMRFILVSGQIQLRTPFSRPEGALVRELPLYYNFRISLTF